MLDAKIYREITHSRLNYLDGSTCGMLFINDTGISSFPPVKRKEDYVDELRNLF